MVARLRLVTGLCGLFVLLCSLSAIAADAVVIQDAAHEVGLIVDFGPEAAKAWQPRWGDNVTTHVESGYSIPGVASTLMRIELQLRNPADHEPSHNWFATEIKDLPDGLVPESIDGLRILIGSQTSTQWWVSVDLTLADGQRYSNVIADHIFPPGRMVEYLVPLDRFKNKDKQALTAAKIRQLRGIAFALGGAGAQKRTFYVDQISAYRRSSYDAWVTFTTSHGDNNLFYRDEPVTLKFAPGGKVPANASGVSFDVLDYSGKAVLTGQLPVSGVKEQMVDAPGLRDGYYEVHTFFTDSSGKRIGDRSSIRAEGSVPEGLGTFSVLPCTRQETIDRSKRVGQDAFFGLHGDFLGIADHVGLAWRLEYSAWRYIEAEKPDRSRGLAPWVAKSLAEPPRPDYRFNFQPFVFNIRSSLPEWAVGTGNAAPAFKSWDDAMAVVRDQIRVERHLYPHMKPRIYGGGWEINLNQLPYLSQPPEYKPEDVVELYRRISEVVKAEDPDGIVAGPNPSTLDLKWYESIFKAGVLPYLGAIETHAYNEGVFTPEADDLPGKLAKLRDLIRKYNNGKDLPIYVTERGDPGVLGSGPIYREQAELMTRSCIILKGEGVRVFHPFYGIDYDATGFGFCFNLEMEGPGGPWATHRVTPKPMVNAIATCVRLLEGATPTHRIRTFGDDVWAYEFQTESQTILALWTTGQSRSMNLPRVAAGDVQVVSMMGATQGPAGPTGQGTLSVTIGSAPIYVLTPRSSR